MSKASLWFYYKTILVRFCCKNQDLYFQTISMDIRTEFDLHGYIWCKKIFSKNSKDLEDSDSIMQLECYNDGFSIYNSFVKKTILVR